ncbi:hypothetical protein Gohar_020582 [Gossypium harknessii]|uniref:DUF4283 domain-containing protein n=1 Tax=Gossypium harknessii TaxID=34285 RepID=A0A7J9I0U9_9ROSI|nr:hypothetical protein [Gossypium harknessii]
MKEEDLELDDRDAKNETIDGIPNITFSDQNDYFSVKLQDDNEYQHTLSRGPWMILGHYLTMRKAPTPPLHTIVRVPSNLWILTHWVVDKPQKLQVNRLSDGCEYTTYLQIRATRKWVDEPPMLQVNTLPDGCECTT